MALVKTTAGFLRALGRAWNKKWSFLAASLLVFVVSVTVLTKLDLLPEPKKEVDTKSAPVVKVEEPIAAPELPTKIEIPTIKLSVNVANPESTEVSVLDNALLKGAVRYPTSAKLGAEGNVIIFGHSSYLPVVHNQAFKAFDGIQDLHAGDQIMVTGSDHVYVYAVETVSHADATEDAIPLTVSGSKLTLATCDSFGTHSDRFVVTARLVETYPRAS